MENTNSKSAEQKKNSKNARKFIILGVEVVLLSAMLCLLWFVTKFTDEDEGIKKVEITTEDIIINEGLQDKNEISTEEHVAVVEKEEKVDKYRTIALFGLDSTIGELTSGTRSDTIMVATIDNSTKEVHIMSVYRDTYLNLGNDTYNKCNAAYARGGAKQAINMLNMNLDLDITDFVAVGFKGVMDTVNAIGGIYIDVDSDELKHINNYQISIADNLKTTYKPLTEPGYQLVDGIQATAYCRIRQVGNNDFKRTERQREVLQAILNEAKDIDVKTLTKLAEDVFGDFYTSVDLDEIVTLLSDLGSYTLVDEGGFPTQEYRTGATLGQNVGDSVICTDLEAAVAELHKKIYGVEEYLVTDTVKEIGATIAANTKPYLQ